MNRTRITAVVLIVALRLADPVGAHAQQGEYGTIPSTFSVDQFLGEAQYSMPIFTPEGRGSLQPHLSLVYRHRGGDGGVGIGWAIAGASAITRCAQTVAQDGKVREVRYDFEDRYCLDGQRLIQISGTYGTDGSVYRTEIDGFRSIVAVGAAGNGPREFYVTDREGTRYLYGHVNNSSLAIGSTYRTWNLYRIQDRFDNTVDFTWEKNDATGVQRLAIVNYGGTNAYRVTFNYVTRPTAHQRSGFVWGAPWAELKRLTTISVQRYVSGWQNIHTYNLGYVPEAEAPDHSLLETVQQCGPTMCLNGSFFEWANGQVTSASYGAATTASATWTPTSYSVLVGDFNGDGQEDVATPYNTGTLWTEYGVAIYYASNGTLSPPDVQLWGYCSSYRVIEFDGDGRADLLCIDSWYGTGSPASLHVKKSTPTGWVNYSFGTAWWDANYGAFRVQVADINGDTLSDLIYGLTQSSWAIALNTGGAFGSPTTLSLDPSVVMTLGTWVNTDDDPTMELVAPYNNMGPYIDGVAVLQHNASTGQLDLVSTELGLSLHPYQLGNPYTPVPLPDINGDGLADLAYRKYGSSVVHTRLNLGNDFGSEQTTTVPSAQLTAFGQYGDANNDGRTDLFLQTGPNGTWQAHLSDGTTFALGSGSLFIDAKLDFADITGDGRRDAVYRGTGATTWYIHPQIAPLKAITTFWDGLGNWQKPTYATISTMTDYALGTATPETHPRRFTRGPLYVVDYYEANTGTDVTGYTYATGVTGASYTINYQYQGARANNQGRGFLGFSTLVWIDSRTGLYGAWKHRQDFPYVGRLDNSWVFQPGGPPIYGVMSEDPVWNHAQWSQLTGTRYFVYEDSRTTNFREVGGPSNGQLIRTVVVDPIYETTYGSIDLETITTTAYSGESYTTTIDYALQHLTTTWCLGLPDAVTVTRSGYLMTAKTRTVDNVFNSSTCRLESTTDTSEPTQDKQLKKSYTYDSFGNIKTATLNSANGGPSTERKAELFYDGAGHLPTSQKRYIAGEFDHVESMTWDYRFILPASRSDARGTTSFQYDELGRITREDRPNGTYTTWLRGLCTSCIGSADGLYWEYEILSNGLNLLRHWDTYGREFAASRNTTQTGGQTLWRKWRDALGRVEEEVLPYESGAPTFSVFYQYDLANRVIQENRPISEAQPSGAISTWVYDRLTETILQPGNPSSQSTAYTTDALGRIMRVTDSLSGIAQYEYNAFDQLTKATDPAGHFAQISYDDRGDKISTADPDMGTWFYDYTAFGELKTRTDAKSQTVTLDYDQLGRLYRRSEPDFPGQYTNFTYYNTTDYKHGLPNYEVAPDGFERDYFYDALGRLSQERTIIDGTGYWTDFAYYATGTGQGKLQRITYPQSTGGIRVQVDYEYGTSGLLSKVKDAAAGTTFYEVGDLDPLLRVTQATIGGLARTQTYDRANLLLKSIQAGSGASIQNLAYDWYPSGNLKQRIDYFSGKTEDFAYDALNRLDTQTLNSTQILNVDYTSGGDGNIGFKTLVGTYTYGGTSGGPHAVTSITGIQNNTYNYDANGNMTNRDGDVITWYSHNLPKRINYGTDSTEFWYGTDRGRYKQVAVEGGSTVTTRYVGDYFEVEQRGTLSIYRHNIRARDGVVAVLERRSDGSNPVRYLHREQLGSIVATTDGNGVLQQRFELEPYGTRWRTVGSGADDTERGFTGHEHLDSVDLIHMNGRVQDPMLGRFISADPFVLAPYYSQSLNRYSYVWNNPLTLTDPSGFCPDLEDPVCMQWTMLQTDSLAAAGVGGEENNLTLVASVAGAAPVASTVARIPYVREAVAVGIGITVTAVILGRPSSHLSGLMRPEIELGPQLIEAGTSSQSEQAPSTSLDMTGSPNPDEDPEDQRTRTPTDRYKEHLTRRDLDAARRELRGEVVSRRPDGTPFDHVDEVRNAQAGLLNRIEQIKNRLGYPRLDPAERASLTSELSEASRLLDYSRQFVP